METSSIVFCERIYKKGPSHHLWKGGSSFYEYTRSLLYHPWIFPILNRDNFVCQKCKKISTIYHVHHIRSFKDIMLEVLYKYKIDPLKIDSLKIENFKLFDELANEVVKKHKLEDGITVCPNCHREIDPHYRRKTHENQKYIEKTI